MELDASTLQRYQAELDTLGERALSLDAVDGLLTAMALSPTPLEIGAHYAEVTGGSTPNSELIELLHSHLREIRADLKQNHLRDPILLEVEDADDDSLSLASWLLGFSQGMALAEEPWRDALEQESLAKVAAPLLILLGEVPALLGEEESELDDDAYVDCVEELPLVLGEIDSYFKSLRLQNPR